MSTRGLLILVAMLAVQVGCAAPPEAPVPDGGHPPRSHASGLDRPLVVRDEDGRPGTRPETLLGCSSPDLVVLVFTSTTCPIANASTPAILRLADACRAHEAELVLVHPDPLASAASIGAHAEVRGLEGIAQVLDPGHRLVERFDASVVPEVFVLQRGDDGWSCGYRGPIDDLYAGIGRRRRAATRSHAVEAVERLSSGDEVEQPRRIAHGCAIERVSSR